MAAARPRECLPMRRRAYTQKVRIGDTNRGIKPQVVFLACGLYEDGTLGEIFIDSAKQGAALRVWMAQTAMLFSIALQHGTSLGTLVNTFVGTTSEPSGKVVGHPRITTCTGVMDYVVRALAIDFLGREDLADRSKEDTEGSCQCAEDAEEEFVEA